MVQRLSIPLLLLAGCDTVGRANDPDEALHNCEVLQALVTEHCSEATDTTAIQCAWGPRRPLGKMDPISGAEGCVQGVCEAALDEAERQCERGSTANFFVGPPQDVDTEECCLEPSEGCVLIAECL